MRKTAMWVAAVVALGLAGCRSSWKRDGSFEPMVEAPRIGAPCTSVAAGTAPAVSRVMPGDTLIGNLRPGQCQCFHFEGVAYTLLDLDLEVACGDGAPPTLTITDPDGRPLDAPVTVSKGGLSAAGVILRKTGTYSGKLCREACGEEQMYRFSYAMRLAGQEDRRMFLTPESDEKVSFVATRGANCVLRIRPDHACSVTPKVVMVKGPDGLRALAIENQLQGACPPRVLLDRGATRTLTFIAPQPGRYTVHLAAEEGTEGDATTHVAVFPPRLAGAQAVPRRPRLLGRHVPAAARSSARGPRAVRPDPVHPVTGGPPDAAAPAAPGRGLPGLQAPDGLRGVLRPLTTDGQRVRDRPTGTLHSGPSSRDPPLGTLR